MLFMEADRSTLAFSLICMVSRAAAEIEGGAALAHARPPWARRER